MPTLLSALSLGPHWMELLIGDPDAFDVLLESQGRSISDSDLVGDLLAELESFDDERSIVAALCAFDDGTYSALPTRKTVAICRSIKH